MPGGISDKGHMVMEKIKNGIASPMAQLVAIVAALITIVTSAFYVGVRVTTIEAAIQRIEERQMKVIPKLDNVVTDASAHKASDGHPILVQRVDDLIRRVEKIEDKR